MLSFSIGRGQQDEYVTPNEPEPLPEVTSTNNLPNIQQAKELELDVAMTEAVLSGTLLKNDIMDGNEAKMRGVFAKSLPICCKEHVYDGIDVTFIERDILSRDRQRYTPSGQSDQLETAETTPPTPTMTGTNYTHVSHPTDQSRYRSFLREREDAIAMTQLRRHPPPMKARSPFQPTSYNAFISLESSPGSRSGPATPLPEISKSSVARCEEWKPRELARADLARVQEHIARVNELLGRGAKGAGKDGPRARSQIGSRRTALAPEVLGSWSRAGSALRAPPVRST